MTLNITILSPNIIYQSADYALFDERAGKPLLTPSTKAVVLAGFHWTGFITYTGIGRIGNTYTSEYVQEWVGNLDSPSFEDVIEIIRNRASVWIQAVQPFAPHTFVVAAFVDGVPTAAVVSNFQKWQGSESTTIDKNFGVSTIAAQRTEVIVTGIRDAVPRPRRRALQRLAEEYSHDGSRVRRAMAEATRDGAERYPGRISAESFVYSQDSAGRGHYETIGGTRTEDPMVNVGGTEANRLIRNLLDKHFGRGRWFPQINDERQQSGSIQLTSAV